MNTHQHNNEQPDKAQQKAKIESLKKSWQLRKDINEKLSKIKNKIAVYSGKGGVGKTTVAVNIAAFFAQQGNSVGILDADIDCPNVVNVFGVNEKPLYKNNQIIPSKSFGVKVVSMGFFQKDELEATIWRGPMIHNAITQFLQMTDWGDLDYLIVDLPPGTSDAPLSIMQNLPLDGFVIVTTPQPLAKLDAQRSINMVTKLKLKIIGITENFSGDIFGKGAGKQLAEDLSHPFLGHISLRPEYQNMQKPTILDTPEIFDEYSTITKNITTSLETSEK